MEQQDNGEVVITAPYEAFQAFVVSSVWADLRTELITQKRMVEGTLAVANESREIYRLQGQLLALEDILTMPDDFIRLMEERASSATVPTEFEDQDTDSNPDAYYTDLLDKYQGE